MAYRVITGLMAYVLSYTQAPFFPRQKPLSLPIGQLKPALAIWPSGFYFPSRPNLTHMKSSMINISYQDQIYYDQRMVCSEIHPLNPPVTSTVWVQPSYNLIHDILLFFLDTDEKSTLCPASSASEWPLFAKPPPHFSIAPSSVFCTSPGYSR